MTMMAARLLGIAVAACLALPASTLVVGPARSSDDPADRTVVTSPAPSETADRNDRENELKTEGATDAAGVPQGLQAPAARENVPTAPPEASATLSQPETSANTGDDIAVGRKQSRGPRGTIWKSEIALASAGLIAVFLVACLLFLLRRNVRLKQDLDHAHREYDELRSKNESILNRQRSEETAFPVRRRPGAEYRAGEIAPDRSSDSNSSSNVNDGGIVIESGAGPGGGSYQLAPAADLAARDGDQELPVTGASLPDEIMQDVLALPETTESSTGNGTKVVTHARLMEIVQNAYNMGRSHGRDLQSSGVPGQPFPAAAESGAALREKQALQNQLRQLRADKQDVEAEMRRYKAQLGDVTGERDHERARISKEKRAWEADRADLNSRLDAERESNRKAGCEIQDKAGEIARLKRDRDEDRGRLEQAASEQAAWATERATLVVSRDEAVAARDAAVTAGTAEAERWAAGFKSLQEAMAPLYCFNSAKDAFDELRAAAMESEPAATALAYLGVIRSFPLSAGQRPPSALLDAFAEFGRQLVQYRRSAGDDETAIANYLKTWARIISSEDRSGVTIIVPVVGSGLDTGWMTYTFGTEVTTLRSWCVRIEGLVAKKAEVNFR